MILMQSQKALSINAVVVPINLMTCLNVSDYCSFNITKVLGAITVGVFVFMGLLVMQLVVHLNEDFLVS